METGTPTQAGSDAEREALHLAHDLDEPIEEIEAFVREHPSPDHEASVRYRRLGNGIVLLAVVATVLAVIVWLETPLGSVADRVATAALPLLAVVGVLLRRAFGEVVYWVEEYPDPMALADDALADYWSVNRFDASLGWLMLPTAALLVRAVWAYPAVSVRVSRVLVVSLFIGLPVVGLFAGAVGYWFLTRHRRRWYFRLANLAVAWLVVVGAVWGLNVVFDRGPGTAYVATVAESWRESYYDGLDYHNARMNPPIYLEPFAGAPRGLMIPNPWIDESTLAVGQPLRVVIGRGAFGLPWVRSYRVATPK